MFQTQRSIRSLIGIAAVAFSTLAGAQGVQVSVHTGVGMSDNVQRVPGNEQEETIAEVGMDILVDYESKRLDIEAIGDFVYQSYLEDTFDDDLIASFTGTGRLAIVEDHLNWVVENSFGQTRQNLDAGITPENRENINLFQTGPDFSFLVPGDNTVTLSGRVQRVDYERSPLDSDRTSGTFSFTHELSGVSRLGVYLRAQSAEYTSLSEDADYDSQDAFLRYELTNSRNSLTIDAGANKVEGQEGDQTGPLIMLNYTRHITDRSTLWVEFNRELTDSGLTTASLAGLPTSDGSDLGLSQTSQPFTLDFIMLGWEITGRRTDLRIAGARFDESHEGAGDLSRSRTRDQYTVQFNRELGGGWSASTQARYDRNEFETGESDFIESSLWLGVAKRFTRQLYFDAAFEHFSRNSDAVQSDYDENRFWLRFRYGGLIRTPFGQRRAQSTNMEPRQ